MFRSWHRKPGPARLWSNDPPERSVAIQSTSAIFYNEVEEDDIRGVHHDESSYINADMLKRHLSTVDADFLLLRTYTILASDRTRSYALGVPSDRRRCEALHPIHLFVVAAETFNWKSLGTMAKVPRYDTMVMIVVTLVTMLTNLPLR